MTGWTQRYGGEKGIPFYINRFYVARAPEGKVALWATYTNKWMYNSNINKPNPRTLTLRRPYGKWMGKYGDVQENFDDYQVPTTLEREGYYLQVEPTSDGKVRLKTDFDSYIMAEEHYYYDDNGSTYQVRESYKYMYNESRTKWTVVDLGKLDLPLPESSEVSCGSSRNPKTCYKAGPEVPEFTILG
jgi:hypothetical protein